MRRFLPLSAGAALGLLVGCNPPPPAPDVRLTIRPDFPPAVLGELRAWYATLPAAFLAGGERFDAVFLAQDGKLYATSDALLARQGQVVPDGQAVRFRDGGAGPSLPALARPDLGALSTTYPDCTPAADGPFWRSWSGPGFSVISAVLNISSAVFPAPIGRRPWAAYQYLGGQAGGGSEVDAGLVYYAAELRAFYNVGGFYAEARHIAPGHAVSVGGGYPTRLGVNGRDTLILRVDRPDGTSSILMNLPAAPGFNAAGADQYWKRTAAIANGDLLSVFPNGYDGSVKYGASGVFSFVASKLGTFFGGALADWSASHVSADGCAVTGTAVSITSGSPRTNDVTVGIDMGR